MRAFPLALLLALAGGVHAQAAPAAAGKVVASGSVPNESTKAAVLERLRQVYGAERVVDQLEVGGVVAPARWNEYVAAMITPELKAISGGKLEVSGNTITVSGEVANEATRQDVLSRLSGAFDAHYALRQELRIGASKQQVLDDTLANRTVEFRSGSAELAAEGRGVLDEMALAIRKVDNPFILIIGNTDDVGSRAANLALSLARAAAVKDYLVARGIPAANLSVSGQGPDNPIADNATETGRARNRRIDFRITRG